MSNSSNSTLPGRVASATAATVAMLCVAMVATDIERIQRHVNRMQAQAKSSGDTAALAKLADVEKQLGIARRSHAALHEHHAEEAIAPATAMSLAQKVNDALRAAHAEHDEVVKRLGTPEER